MADTRSVRDINRRRPTSGARSLISTCTIGSCHLDVRIAATRSRATGRRGRGRLGREQLLKQADARAGDAQGYQGQPHDREHDDHDPEPPGTGRPCRVLKRPEHPHPGRTLGDVPGEMDQQPGRQARRARPDAGDWPPPRPLWPRGQRMRDGRWYGFSHPEIQRNVIQIDSHRLDKTRDIEPTRYVDEHNRASRPSAPVTRWATSSSAPLARMLNGTLRSAASNASATAASRTGTVHNLIRSRSRNPTHRCYAILSTTPPARPAEASRRQPGELSERLARRARRTSWTSCGSASGWTVRPRDPGRPRLRTGHRAILFTLVANSASRSSKLAADWIYGRPQTPTSRRSRP